jgi:hypothetical protein
MHPKGRGEMGIAAGGLIDQNIVRDPCTREWDSSNTKVLNVQILNSIHFSFVTGKEAHDPGLSAETYAEYGFPFFKMYEEPTNVAGKFNQVKGVAELDGVQEPALSNVAVVDMGRADEIVAHRAEGFFNPEGPKSSFVSLKEIEEELRKVSLN